jgi:hypothetical protein
MTETEPIHYKDGEIVITEDAPDYVHEWLESLGDDAGNVLNFLITLEIDDKDALEYDIIDGRELAESHRDQMEQAVKDGDIESAQHHQTLANLYQTHYNEYLAKDEPRDTAGRRGSLRQRVKKVINEIDDREDTFGAPIPLIEKNLTDIDGEEVKETIQALKERGEVYEPRSDQLKVT